MPYNWYSASYVYISFLHRESALAGDLREADCVVPSFALAACDEDIGVLVRVNGTVHDTHFLYAHGKANPRNAVRFPHMGACLSHFLYSLKGSDGVRVRH